MSLRKQFSDERIKFSFHVMGFTFILAVSLIIVFHPSVSSHLQNLGLSQGRKVLSVITGDIKNTGENIKVVKLLANKEIRIEIYGPHNPNGRKLLQSLSIPDPHDGFFHLRGQATNLALDDIDNDKTLEILVPSFDEALIAHLTVYKFDPNSNSFSRVSADANSINN